MLEDVFSLSTSINTDRVNYTVNKQSQVHLLAAHCLSGRGINSINLIRWGSLISHIHPFLCSLKTMRISLKINYLKVIFMRPRVSCTNLWRLIRLMWQSIKDTTEDQRLVVDAKPFIKTPSIDKHGFSLKDSADHTDNSHPAAVTSWWHPLPRLPHGSGWWSCKPLLIAM